MCRRLGSSQAVLCGRVTSGRVSRRRRTNPSGPVRGVLRDWRGRAGQEVRGRSGSPVRGRSRTGFNTLQGCGTGGLGDAGVYSDTDKVRVLWDTLTVLSRRL